MKALPLLASTVLLTFTSLFAVSTDPVGYVSISSPDNSDVRVGVPFLQAAVSSGIVDSVSGGQVNVSTAYTVDQFNTDYFILFTDGTLDGQWFQIFDTDINSVTIADDLAALGLSSADPFKIVPFWTLDTLFPNGGNIPVSTDAFNPVALVSLNDPSDVGVNLATSESYIYHDGSSTGQGAGWYDNNNVFGGPLGATTLVTPESYITIRNTSGSEVAVVFSGNVPVSKMSTEVGRLASEPQDNLIFNPYPIEIPLDDLGLVSSGAFDVSTDAFNPTDLLLIYDNEVSSGINSAPSASYIYHDGSSTGQGAGWYDNNNIFGGTIGNSAKVPVGGAMIVRKANGSAGTVTWSPVATYFDSEDSE